MKDNYFEKNFWKKSHSNNFYFISRLSSLSFTDIYGLSTTSETPSMVDLHKKILPPPSSQPPQPPRSTSQQSLSPHSSLSSLSPPVTPLETGYSFDSRPAKQPLRLSTIDEANRVGLG